MKTKHTFLVVVITCLLVGCTSDIINIENTGSLTLSEQQLKFRENLKQSALLITNLVKNPDVVRELKFSVDYNREELERDEDVYFSELFDEDASYKQAVDSKLKQHFVGSFADAFGAH